MRYLKQILLIIFKDESRLTYSVPTSSSHKEVYDRALNAGDIVQENIKKVLFFPNTFYDLEEFQYYYDEETKTLDDKAIAIDYKIDEFRKQRAPILKNLDMEFMKALEGEEDCVECKKSSITNNKKYLRNVPKILPYTLHSLDAEEITHFNCFNNIFHIVIINGGSGYTEPPEITISEPDLGKTTSSGFQLKGKSVIEDGKVIKVEVTQVGSNYSLAPSVSFSKPEDPSGNVAIGFASDPENDMF
jgi:hypothetical protein